MKDDPKKVLEWRIRKSIKTCQVTGEGIYRDGKDQLCIQYMGHFCEYYYKTKTLRRTEELCRRPPNEYER